MFCNNALCDLGASVNIMPYSLFQKLDIGEVRPTTISLQLADHSIVYPRGIIEDVLMKVEHFIFPVDFVALDMEEDRGKPLILGRSFFENRKNTDRCPRREVDTQSRRRSNRVQLSELYEI